MPLLAKRGGVWCTFAQSLPSSARDESVVNTGANV